MGDEFQRVELKVFLWAGRCASHLTRPREKETLLGVFTWIYVHLPRGRAGTWKLEDKRLNRALRNRLSEVLAEHRGVESKRSLGPECHQRQGTT